ncbi:MAG: HAD family phosphatase [Bryobacteraceae bacterium]
MLSRYDAVLFDFDGVLIDSEPIHFACWSEVFQPFGVTLEWERDGKNVVGLSDRATVEYFCSLGNPPLSPELLYREYPKKSARFAERLVKNPVWADGIPELLRSLDTIKKAIVTSSIRSEVEPILQAGALLPLVDAVVYGDDVRVRKPDPEPYQHAARILGVKAPLVVEDSDAGEQSGRAAGFDVLRVPDPSDTARLVRERLGLA